MAGRLLGLVCALALAGCLDGTASFHCGQGRPCDDPKRCIDSSCAAADSACPSGYRWDDTAGDRALECSTEQDMAVDPNCGNGAIDPGETCDDGAGSPTPCPTACDDVNPCTTDVLVGDGCHRQCLTNLTGHENGSSCTFPDGGATGRCFSFQCCTGCLDNACLSGQQPGSCGAGGEACQACSGGECQAHFCDPTGVCGTSPIPNSTPCDGGACAAGSCCGGCVQTFDGGATCQPGTTMSACGSGGSPCTSCANPCATDGGVARCANCAPVCTGRVCGSDGCGGQCGTCPNGLQCQAGRCVCVASGSENSDQVCGDNVDQDCDTLIDCKDPDCANKRCGNKLFCSNSVCTAGCRILGVFYPSGAVGPTACLVCDPSKDDSGWSPVTDGTACGNGAASGKCYRGGCCLGCWDGNTCQAPGPATCGAGGAACVDCTASQGTGCGLCQIGKCVTIADGGVCSSNCLGACGSCASMVSPVCKVTTACTNHSCQLAKTQCCTDSTCGVCL